MKIVVVGSGYVGLSNAVLLAQHNEVIGVDISHERVDALNARKSPIFDDELSEYLAEKDLNLSASTDLKTSVSGADYVIVSTPTNYDEKTNFFDTSSVEAVIAQVIESEPSACIVVTSTIPVGLIDEIRERLKTEAPSNLASIGRYILTPDIFKTLSGLSTGFSSEIQLADAINVHALTGEVEIVKCNAKRFNCGSPADFVAACNHVWQSEQSSKTHGHQ